MNKGSKKKDGLIGHTYRNEVMVTNHAGTTNKIDKVMKIYSTLRR